MNDIDEKRKNTEKINFAMQGMFESSQFTIAIAVGGLWNPYLIFYDPYAYGRKSEFGK